MVEQLFQDTSQTVLQHSLWDQLRSLRNRFLTTLVVQKYILPLPSLSSFFFSVFCNLCGINSASEKKFLTTVVVQKFILYSLPPLSFF